MADDEFTDIFQRLREVLRRFEPGLLLKADTATDYSLDAPSSERWKRELFFGAVQVRKSYVSFHLMPVYMFPDLLDGTSNALRRRMQGKSCFNFKRPEPELFTELEALTARGHARLQAEGFLGG